MKIIKYQKLKSNKYKVTLENDDTINLYDNVILDNNLLLTKEINDIDDILKQNDYYDAYFLSIKYISRKQRTNKEIYNYLKNKFDISIINDTINRLEKEGYLNEDIYIKSYINDQVNLTNNGYYKILRDLKNNGLDEDKIVSCLDNIDKEVWIEKAKRIIDKFLNIKVRVINVIDLMRLESSSQHPHGMSDDDYNALFTKNKPIIFAFHGYPTLIHMLTYKRKNKNMHVHGYKEEGTITTPFDMRVQNEIDRYHLVLNAVKYVELSKSDRKNITSYCESQLEKHYNYIRENGEDMPEVDKLI